MANISNVLHQILFGWFATVPTIVVVCISAAITFVVAAWRGRSARLAIWFCSFAVPAPSLVPLLISLSSSESRSHGATILANFPIIGRLVLASELMWLPVGFLALRLGLRVYRKRSAVSIVKATF